jgi:hypothetical protein
MKLKNDFSLKTRALFCYEYNCWECGRSDKGVELHHILGRVSSSPLNCCPLCRSCHQKEVWLLENKKKWLKKCLKHLLKDNYLLDKKDLCFYQENRKYYL